MSTFLNPIIAPVINGLTITASSSSLVIATSKSFTISNTLTLLGTDGSSLNIGTGGNLGTAAFTDSTVYPLLNGRSGGQTIIGGTSSGSTLTLQSTSNATKGKILFGNSAYDEVNNRLGLGSTSPSSSLEIAALGVTGIRESIIKASVSDSTNDAFFIYNGTSADGNFAPTFGGICNTSSGRTSLQFVGMSTSANDTGAVPIVRIASQLTTSATDPTNGTLSTVATRPILDIANFTTSLVTFLSNGRVGIGTTTPTGVLHIKAGTASANTAPLKLTSGTVLTTPETGAIEFDGSHFYGSIGTTRYQLDQQLASAYQTSSVSTTSTLSTYNKVYFVSGSITITIPTAGSKAGQWFKISNNGTNSVTLSPTGTEKLGGSASITLTANSSVELISDGTNYTVF